ncbi:hypothetical protein G9A89_007422 [Geosiphon pyriformis]|nr:hypothetical protein G9A89_007422 [Geosiphon pyriformis]
MNKKTLNLFFVAIFLLALIVVNTVTMVTAQGPPNPDNVLVPLDETPLPENIGQADESRAAAIGRNALCALGYHHTVVGGKLCIVKRKIRNVWLNRKPAGVVLKLIVSLGGGILDNTRSTIKFAKILWTRNSWIVQATALLMQTSWPN